MTRRPRATRRLLEETAALTAAADAALCRRIDGSRAARPVVVVNSLSWERSEWLRLAGRWVKAQVPPLGYAVIDAAARASFVRPAVDGSRLENDKLRIVFNDDGSICSCFDKEHGREVLAPGAAGNVLAIYRDDGDAWDIPMDYRERAPERLVLEAVETVVDGPRAALCHRYRYGNSVLRQEVAVFAGSRRVDFVTSVDWHESERMLRTSFPVDITASEATCDIQFGSIRRPTHCNTPADLAKFEVCAHQWVDLSDRDYGVALLNDCKYGHHLRGNILDLNLLRSPGYPDPTADRGHHRFTYSLYPHAGDHVAGRVARAGSELNVPLRPLASAPGGGTLPAARVLADARGGECRRRNGKRGRRRHGLIVRLYEAAGAATSTVLHCGFALAAAEATDLIEENPRAGRDRRARSARSPFARSRSSRCGWCRRRQ